MNELQQVLLIFAMIVVVGLIVLNQVKAKKQSKSTRDTKLDTDISEINSNGLNSLGEPHLPLSEKTQHRLHLDDEKHPEESVPDNQLGLSFGQEFEVEKALEASSNAAKSDKVDERRKPEEIVIESKEELDSDKLTAEKVSPSQAETKSGIEERVFALIIMGSEDFLWSKVNQTLQGVGLVPAQSGIFVKLDTMGDELIRVANLLEPGTFPLEETINSDQKIAGLVLILSLPTSVQATGVMREMILMARKISQRLNGRLYDVNRHLIKESDLQAMRDAAAYFDNIS